MSVRGFSPSKLGSVQTSYEYVKGVLIAQSLPGKQQPRAVLLQRAALQWYRRALLFRHATPYTQAYADLVQDLVKMSLGHYAAVRSPAQKALGHALAIFPMVRFVSNSLRVLTLTTGLKKICFP